MIKLPKFDSHLGFMLNTASRSGEVPTWPAEARLAFLDGIRGVAIAFVVAIHASAYVGISLSSSSATYNVMYALAVPPFFAVDGFLFLHRIVSDKMPPVGAYIRRSAKRLLLPWIVFSFIYLGLRASYEFLNPPVENILWGQPPGKLLMHLYFSTAAPHLYFLPSLFLVRVWALACQRLFQAGFWVLFLTLGVYAILFEAYIRSGYHNPVSVHGLDPVLHSFWGAQYYLLGIILFRLWSYVKRYPYIILTAVVLTAPVWVLYPTTKFVFQFSLIVGLFSLILIISNCPEFLPYIGRHTMGIYLLHSPIPIKLFQILITSKGEMAVMFVFVWMCTLLASLLASVALVHTSFGRLILGLPYSYAEPSVRGTVQHIG